MSRRGFSLVEVMVAIVILATGILALAATSASVTRLISQGGSLGASAVAAEGQFELLRATPCGSLANGSTTAGKYTLAWTIASSNLLRTATVTVQYSTGRGTRTDTYTTTISCAT